MVHQPSMPSSDSLGRATQKASEFVFSRSPMILLLSSICCFFAGFLYICFFVQKNVCFIWYDPVSSSELSFLQHVRRFAPSFTPFFQRQNGHGGSGLGPEQRGTVPPSTGHGAHEKMPGLDWFEHRQKSSIYDGKIHDCPIDVQLFNQKNNCWFD